MWRNVSRNFKEKIETWNSKGTNWKTKATRDIQMKFTHRVGSAAHKPSWTPAHEAPAEVHIELAEGHRDTGV